jgi:alkylated DNA repair dioxygenase AlkB
LAGVRGLIVFRRWRLDHELLLAGVRQCFAYSNGDGRATGYLDEPWLGPVLADLDNHLQLHFTVVAFQAYRNGRAGCDWHADANFEAQAILSLGASRTLGTRRGDEVHRTWLDAGDLVYMPPGFQREWEHCVPLEPDVPDERISLVFRTVGEPCTPS